ncbi:MAG: pyridoxal-dependent decarboxylase [Candidatus Baltobacteraceae bacterium]
MLDPADWKAFREQTHRILDESLDYLQGVRERKTWTAVPPEVRERLASPLPVEASDFGEVYQEFARDVLPYNSGNIHPRFFGWVQGSGTAAGAIADLLAATMNSNCGGRDHGAIYVERQVVEWFKELFHFPESASGLLVTGTSMANLIAVLVARTNALGDSVRELGLQAQTERLVGYASASTHGCVRKAFENAGLGGASLRILPIDAAHRVNPAEIASAIRRDRDDGLRPFMIVGNAGSVDIGAIDPLVELADLAKRENLWLHVDGAFGALTMLSEKLRPALRGIERADSLAFDFHKWLHVPYDAGCVLVRDGEVHRATFSTEGPYITRMDRGLAAGEPWFTDFGPDLSRSFRALKVWFTIKQHGVKRLAESIERNCAQALYLRSLVEADSRFELMAPVTLNIVCFRYLAENLNAAELDRFNDDLVIALQESGVAVTSSTTIGERRAIRVCIVNHRTEDRDLKLLLQTLGELAARRGVR